MYQAEILADSMSPEGMRLTTIQVTYPHAIHKDILTHRCQPTGTMVRIPVSIGHRSNSSEVPIESLNIGDLVTTCYRTRVSASGYIRKCGNQIVDITSRNYSGDLIMITSEGYTSRYTPEHPCIVLIKDAFDQKHVVYMMERNGYYKIGLTRGSSSQCNKSGVAARILTEDADALWILGVYDTRAEASRQESLWQYRFNIPGWCFRDIGHGVEENTIWREIEPNRALAENALWSLGREISLPFWKRGNSLKFKQQAHTIAACNLVNGMSVLIADNARQVIGVRQIRLTIPHSVWTPITVSRERYEGEVVSLEVEANHNYFADGILTHNCFSRNFQSFRAYPPEKVIETIERDPFIPESFDTRVKGMGQGEALDDQQRGRDQWMRHIENSLTTARKFISMDMAKAQVNFVLQDLTWITGIITATEWDNFFALRLATDQDGKPLARPEVYKIAKMMKEAIDHSEPAFIRYDEWHLPLVELERYKPWDHWWKMVSVGRCARVSYLTHDGRQDAQKDIALHDRLMKDGHMSPFEHIARPFFPGEWYIISKIEEAVSKSDNSIESLRQSQRQQMVDQCRFSGNFFGWHQYRKDISCEDNFAEMEKLNG